MIPEGAVWLLLQVLIFLGPLVICGLIIGRTVERRHFARLDQFDAENSDFLVSQLKSYPMAAPDGPDPAIMMSEVVIASDYLKTFLSAWRRIFGGELRSFQTLQTRAKREVVHRLITSARAAGFNAICNVRMNTVDISGAAKTRQGLPMATVVATATAYMARSRS